MRGFKKRRVVPLLAVLLLLQACGGGGGGGGAIQIDPSALATPQPPPPPSAGTACAALRGAKVDSAAIGLPTQGATVTEAALVPSAGQTGEHCMLKGRIASVSEGAQDIMFALVLPTNWNGNAMHFGGGGFDGVVPDLVTTPLTSGASPLQRGYAIFADDSGHQAPPTDPFYTAFASNSEMLRNYAGDALKKTRDVAMKLIGLRYGKAPGKTYFMGGSKGGHEGMQVMQKWPSDYDGVVTYFPAYAYMPQMMTIQVGTRALWGNGGVGFLGPKKLQTLRAAELAACDALDGAVDGIVGNVAACTFKPQNLRCKGGADAGDDCLSDAQIKTVDTLQSRTAFSYAFKNGATSNPGFLPSTDYASVLGATATFPVPPNPLVLGSLGALPDAFIRNAVLMDPLGLSIGLDGASPGSYLPRIQELSGVMDATSTDIEPFVARGGKWLLVHGTSDPLIPFQGSVDYYNALLLKLGRPQIDAFLRFYQVPGYGHGTGHFNATGGVPVLDALEAWVERGKAPGELMATDANPATAGRSRPLCIYPSWPKYNGSGDLNAASSYRCATS
jgi:feruloyl esterase